MIDQEFTLDAESHSDGQHVALTILGKNRRFESELRLDVELEAAKEFHKELSEAIARTEEKQVA